jgi:IS5 family transposase
MCEELDRLRADAIAAFAEGKRVRRDRDVSFQEDAELCREAYRRADALLKHQSNLPLLHRLVATPTPEEIVD